MAILKVTLPAGAIPVDGLQVSFRVPCGCQSFDKIEIDGVRYYLLDALHRDVTDRGGAWGADAMLSVVLDVTNKKAFLQNSAASINRRSFVSIESPYSLYSTSAGCITVFADTAGYGTVRTIRVFDSMFQPGDVLEICNNCLAEVRVQFINSKVRGPALYRDGAAALATEVKIPHEYGIAKFIFSHDRSCWIASGDVTFSA